MDSESFWASWLRDLEIDQTDEGGVLVGRARHHPAGRHADGRRADREHGPGRVGGCRDHRAARRVRVVRLGRDPRAPARQHAPMGRAPPPPRRRRRRAADRAVPVRRLARSGCPWRPPLGGQGLERLSSRTPSTCAPRGCSRRRSGSSATRTRAADYDDARRPGRDGDVRDAGATRPSRRRPEPRSRSSSISHRPSDARASPPDSPKTSAARTAVSRPASSARRWCCSRCRATATSTRRTSCCCAATRRPGSTRSIAARRRCGSAGTRSCPTAASTPARWTRCRARRRIAKRAACSRSTTTPTAR